MWPTFILVERDLEFSFAKFKMADQYEATEGELNFHKRRTEARKIKISAGNLERTYPKGIRLVSNVTSNRNEKNVSFVISARHAHFCMNGPFLFNSILLMSTH